MGIFKRKESIVAPIEGQLIKLKHVNDPVFSQGMMGEGCAIIPDKTQLVAPISGKIKSIFPTKHALTMTSEKGLDILIHVGIDTVKLKGIGFQLFVQEGQHVSVGEPLLIFDSDQIRSEKLSDTILMLFPEKKDLRLVFSEGPISQGENLFNI